MALDVSVSAEIQRPAPDVAAYAFEPTNDPVWIGGITVAHLLTSRPIGKGTRVQRLAKFLGKTIDYTLEVETFERNHLMIMTSVKGPFPMRVTYRFDPTEGNKTFATLRVQGTARSFYGLADFLMAPMVRRNLKKDLRRLRSVMEQ